jgi:hypothetical protein
MEETMGLLKTAVITTLLVLVTVFALNRIPFTRDLVQAAIK